MPETIKNTDSILTSIKKLLGLTEECTEFDADIIMHINSVFLTLQQIGVGPEEGFAISDSSQTWNDFIPEGLILNSIKSYMSLKVRLLFDPPASSVVVESMNRMVDQFEWRINVAAESVTSTQSNGEEGIQNE